MEISVFKSNPLVTISTESILELPNWPLYGGGHILGDTETYNVVLFREVILLVQLGEFVNSIHITYCHDSEYFVLCIFNSIGINRVLHVIIQYYGCSIVHYLLKNLVNGFNTLIHSNQVSPAENDLASDLAMQEYYSLSHPFRLQSYILCR